MKTFAKVIDIVNFFVVAFGVYACITAFTKLLDVPEWSHFEYLGAAFSALIFGAFLSAIKGHLVENGQNRQKESEMSK
jgi:hypothetical protein